MPPKPAHENQEDPLYKFLVTNVFPLEEQANAPKPQTCLTSMHAGVDKQCAVVFAMANDLATHSRLIYVEYIAHNR